jgi:serine/threonine protein kinase
VAHSSIDIFLSMHVSIDLTISACVLSVKLFDFGLCKEISEDLAVGDGTYKLTGYTGSVRYMAPEVALEKPYNMTCDAVRFECTHDQTCCCCPATLSLSHTNTLSFSLVFVCSHVLANACTGEALSWLFDQGYS